MAFDHKDPNHITAYTLMTCGHTLTVAAASSTSQRDSAMMAYYRKDAVDAVREAAAILGFDLVERVQE